MDDIRVRKRQIEQICMLFDRLDGIQFACWCETDVLIRVQTVSSA